ncbi:hypothetical protein [Saccharothrix variisporea]|uniref:hypothetical protein n=1 Tax=Saccharothrix variisporea TaxID=543527 RepID=UPI0011C44CEC|nr:hypothetical protein [Saccharothrix variisporea]
MAVPGFMLLVALLIAPVAPGKATDGLYRIDADQFSVYHNHISCTKRLSSATCTVSVDGKPLIVTLDTDPRTLVCEATFDGERVGCARTFDYGPGSHRVSVTGVSVPDAVAADLRDRFPWWGTLFDRYWVQAGLLFIGVLGPAAAVASFLWAGRPRDADGRLLVAVPVAGVVGWALSGFALMPWERFLEFGPSLLLVPVVLVMTGWAVVVGRPVTGRVEWRVALALTAFACTVFSSVPVVLWISLAAGIPD